MKPIRNEPGLFRDKTGVIINTLESDYKLILEKRRNKAEMESLKGEIEQLKELIRNIAK